MTARPVVSVDARLAEIEQRAKRARYVTLMGGYGETGDARELLSKDVPWMSSQLRDARADARVYQELYEQRVDALVKTEAALAAVRELVADLAEYGTRADLMPTVMFGAHAVIETSFAPPPHPRCPGPVSQPTEGATE